MTRYGTRKKSLFRSQKSLRLEILEHRIVPSIAPPPSQTSQSLAIDTSTYTPSRILVRFNETASPAVTVPGTHLGDTIPLISGFREIRLDPGVAVVDAVAAYSNLPGVMYAQPDYRVHISLDPNDPLFPQQWALNNTGQTGGTADADIDAPLAWDTTTGSNSVVVAVIDTGVDYNHPDLAANIWTNPGEIAGDGIDNDNNGYIDDIHGYDFANNDSDPMDDHFHGTHVSGTIAAVGNNGIGVAGIAWNVKIMALKFLDSQGGGSLFDAVRALNYAVANGASISNNSWGGGGYDPLLYDAINAARGQGHIFVAAAGNDGLNNDSFTSYPSGYPLNNIVAVAATDHRDQLANFSNYGRTTVDLGAPGVNILSTFPTFSTAAMQAYGLPTNYGSISGTSMATPHVTGVLALIRGLHPEWTYQQVIQQVYDNVDPIPALANTTATGGRLNAAKAVGTAVPDTSGPRVVSSTPTGNVSTSVSSIRFTFNEPITLSSFTLADVQLTGPNGSINPTDVSAVSGTNGMSFDLTFPTQAVPGTYQVVIGPNITDRAVPANLMNQDQDAINGEPLQDQYVGTFTILADTTGPRVVSSTPSGNTTSAVNSVRFTFNESITVSSFTLDDITFSGPNGSITPTGVAEVSGTDGKTFEVTFAQQLTPGTYAMVIGPDITDRAFTPNSMDQDQDGIKGETPDDQYTATFTIVGDTTGPRVVSGQFSGPNSSAVNTIRITFSEPIEITSFSFDDVSLTGPSGVITPSQILEVSGSGGRTFDVNFPLQDIQGTYTIVVGPNITDTAFTPNLMDQDQDGIKGEPQQDQYTTSITLSSELIFESSDIPGPIWDGAILLSYLTINDDITIDDIDVQFNITHTWIADLVISILSPNGSSVLLVNQRGVGGNLFENTGLDDEAGTFIGDGQSPFRGSYRPEESLALMDGESARGTWALMIYDAAVYDEGTLNSWSLIIRPRGAVPPSNNPPSAFDDVAGTNEEQAVTISVLDNDSDPDHDPLTVTSVDILPEFGSAVINADGTITYTPASNYNGFAWFSYTISDGRGGQDSANVMIDIAPVNDAPIAVDDQATGVQDVAITFGGSGNRPALQSNDTDVDGDTLSVVAVSNATNGSVVLNTDGTVSFTPSPGFTGTASFEYTVSDGQATDTGLVSMTITAPVTPGPVYLLTTTTAGTLTSSDGSSVSFTASDILRLRTYSDGSYRYEMYFDGSDVGLTTSGERLDAFTFLSNGTLIVSTTGSSSVPGPSGTVLRGTSQDLLAFTPTSLGTNTAGSWSMYFDGSQVGLSTSSENIDAVAVLPDGRILLSTSGSYAVPGAGGGDTDLVVFSPTSLGTTTAGTWSIYFDGSDVGLRDGSSEDLDAVFVKPGATPEALPTLYYSTRGNFAVPGANGTSSDLFVFHPSALGSSTTGTYDSAFQLTGKNYGLAAFNLSGVHIGEPGSGAGGRVLHRGGNGSQTAKSGGVGTSGDTVKSGTNHGTGLTPAQLTTPFPASMSFGVSVATVPAPSGLSAPVEGNPLMKSSTVTITAGSTLDQLFATYSPESNSVPVLSPYNLSNTARKEVFNLLMLDS